MDQNFLLTQQEKANQFHQLHHNKRLLILPNAWDCFGALLLQDMEYPAVATASASIAVSNGYDDGENISLIELLPILNRIAKCVNIPVTADFESGYAETDAELKQNIRHLIEAGIIGINIEDTDKKTKKLLPVDEQCKKIKLVKETGMEMNIPFFINARTDVYLQGTIKENKFEETIARGKAYKEAGADCFYPITMAGISEIKATVEELKMPVNILAIPGIPSLAELEKTGVARVSLGPSWFKYALQAMKSLAFQLKNYEGINEIFNNTITSAYLKKLVSHDK